MSAQSGVGTGKEAEAILVDVVRHIATIEEIMSTRAMGQCATVRVCLLEIRLG
jgi:hypothetical protein